MPKQRKVQGIGFIKIQFYTDNAAFADDYDLEVARILRTLADRCEHECKNERIIIRDINGNKVGEFNSYHAK